MAKLLLVSTGLEFHVVSRQHQAHVDDMGIPVLVIKSSILLWAEKNHKEIDLEGPSLLDYLV